MPCVAKIFRSKLPNDLSFNLTFCRAMRKKEFRSNYATTRDHVKHDVLMDLSVRSNNAVFFVADFK